MTRAEIRNLVLYWLDDLNAGYFTEPQVNVWINNAQKECQKRLIKAGQNYYVECVQTTLVVNQRSYALPEDIKKINRLEIIVSGVTPNESVTPIIPITLMQQDMLPTGNGTPSCYFLSKNKLTLLPAPDTALVMRLDYSYLVADMTADSDIPDVPESYHEYIALLAAQDGFLKDGRANELLLKKIAEYEKDFDIDAQERNQDLPRGIISTGNDSGAEYYW